MKRNGEDGNEVQKKACRGRTVGGRTEMITTGKLSIYRMQKMDRPALAKHVRKLEYRLELAQNPNWIPIKCRETTDEDGIDKERYPKILDCMLPEDGEEVLVSYKNGYVDKDTFYNDYGCYFDSGRDIDDVLAWQPLPMAYKGE